MDLHCLTRPRIPAAVAFVILPSFLTGCGLATGFGAAETPPDKSALMAPDRSTASPKTSPIPASASVLPARESVAGERPSRQMELEPYPERYNISDGLYNDAGINAEFVALRTIPAAKERPVAKKAEIPRRVEKVSDHDFEQKVVKSDETVLVDFYADWCGPCKKLAPVLDELAQETPDARVAKVDIDRSPKLAEQYGVRSIPTLILFKDGKPVTRRTGLNSKASLKELIAQ